MFQVARKPCGKSLTSGACSSRTNVNLKRQISQQGLGHVTSRRSREMPKNRNLKVSNKNSELADRTSDFVKKKMNFFYQVLPVALSPPCALERLAWKGCPD